MYTSDIRTRITNYDRSRENDKINSMKMKMKGLKKRLKESGYKQNLNNYNDDQVKYFNVTDDPHHRLSRTMIRNDSSSPIRGMSSRSPSPSKISVSNYDVMDEAQYRSV